MISDQDVIFSDDQAVTASAISTNIVQVDGLGDIMGDSSVEEDIFLNLQVTTTTASSGSTTLDVDLVSHSAVPTNATYSVLKVLDDVAKASLVQGYAVSRNLRGIPLKEYTGLYFTVAVANFTAGNFRAWLSRTPFASNQI